MRRGNAGSLSDQDRLDLVFEDGLNDSWAAGNRCEVAVSPAGDSGVGLDAKHDSA